jgi:hypothetical protein
MIDLPGALPLFDVHFRAALSPINQAARITMPVRRGTSAPVDRAGMVIPRQRLIQLHPRPIDVAGYDRLDPSR